MSENERKHSGLPWDVAENPDCENAQYDRFLVRCKTDYPGVYGTVAICGYKLNAEFIVRACNSHYQLIEALQYVINYHRENDSGEGELYGLDFVTTCIGAISKATSN